jgi:RNA polymerase sigma-70 factor (ECF subfamily)
MPPLRGVLVERQGAHDPTAPSTTATFADFYRQHLPFVWRNARQLLGFESNVDDVVQDVFMVVVRRLPEFDGESVRAWLYHILRRVVASHRRKFTGRRVRDSVDLEAIPTRDSGPHRKAEKADALRQLFLMLDHLDDAKREVFILAEIENMTAPQIAQAIEINLTTVHARLRDARRELAVVAQRWRARGEGVGT